jgi:hypothetical protein
MINTAAERQRTALSFSFFILSLSLSCSPGRVRRRSHIVRFGNILATVAAKGTITRTIRNFLKCKRVAKSGKVLSCHLLICNVLPRVLTEEKDVFGTGSKLIVQVKHDTRSHPTRSVALARPVRGPSEKCRFRRAKLRLSRGLPVGLAPQRHPTDSRTVNDSKDQSWG